VAALGDRPRVAVEAADPTRGDARPAVAAAVRSHPILKTSSGAARTGCGA